MTSRRRTAPRDADVGRLVHRVIADLAAGDQADAGWAGVAAAVDHRFLLDGIADRAARQRAINAATAYMSSMRPHGWSLIRAEAPLPGCRLDLLWGFDRFLLVDELKTGPLSPHWRSTSRQAQRYLQRAVTAYGPDLVAIRVLSTDDPALSWVLPGPAAGTAAPAVLAPLPAWATARPCSGMATHPRDHRSASAVTRDILVELSQRPHPPTLPEVKAAVRRHIPDRSSIPSQVLAQRVSGLVATHLRIAPRPIGCTFRPGTLTGSSARQLLTWQDPYGRVTVDLVWMSLSLRPAALQAALLDLVEDGSQVLGQDLQAVRVIDAVRQTVEVHPIVWRRAA